MLNKGYSNNTDFKAVPCNIVEKVFEARDKIYPIVKITSKKTTKNCIKKTLRHGIQMTIH